MGRYFGSLSANKSFVYFSSFGSLTAFVFIQEYQTKSIINLFTTPVHRIWIIISKLITLFLIIMMLIFISHILTLLTGMLFMKHGIWNAFINYLPVSFQTGIMQFFFVPIYMSIGLWTRHDIPPIVTAGIFIMAAFVSLSLSDIGPLIFLALPYYIILQSIGWYGGQISFVWEILLPIFILFYGFLLLLHRNVISINC